MLQPIGHSLVIRPMKPEDTTKGGVVLPTAAQKQETRGVVVAQGDLAFHDDLRVSLGIPAPNIVGQTVWYTQYSGESIKYMGEDLLLLVDDEILGVVPPEDLTQTSVV